MRCQRGREETADHTAHHPKSRTDRGQELADAARKAGKAYEPCKGKRPEIAEAVPEKREVRARDEDRERHRENEPRSKLAAAKKTGGRDRCKSGDREGPRASGDVDRAPLTSIEEHREEKAYVLANRGDERGSVTVVGIAW